MKSSFPRQLSISAAVLVLFLMPLLYAGQVDNDISASEEVNPLRDDDAGNFKFTDVVGAMGLYSPEDFVKHIVVSDIHDIGYVLYEDSDFRDRIVSYYASVTGSEQIAESVLRNAYKNDISFNLAVSLMWAESGYNPDAYNRNPVSVDRGLFQLNSESFPGMTEKQFYDIETNIATGVSYLKYCLDLGDNEIVALAIYNAGHGRVSGRGAPLMTLEYISKIIDYKDELERDFERYISQNGKIRADKKSDRNVIPVKKINTKLNSIKN